MMTQDDVLQVNDEEKTKMISKKESKILPQVTVAVIKDGIQFVKGKVTRISSPCLNFDINAKPKNIFQSSGAVHIIMEDDAMFSFSPAEFSEKVARTKQGELVIFQVEIETGLLKSFS